MPVPASDAGTPFIGEWDTIPGLVSTCGVMVAANPAASIGRLQWGPCAAGRSGCQTLVQNWSPYTGLERILDFQGTEAVRIINGLPVLVYQRRTAVFFGQFTAYVVVAQPLPDADPVFAIGARTDLPSYCSFAAAAGEDGFAVNIGPPHATSLYFGWSPWCAPSSLSVRGLTFAEIGIDPMSGDATFIALSHGRLYLDLLSPNTVGVWDGSSSKVLQPTVGGAPIALDGPINAPDGALALEGGGQSGVGLVRADSTYTRLISPSSGKLVSWFALDRVTSQIAWAESVDSGPSGFTNTVIWSSPYAQTAAGIVPRKIASLVDSSNGGGVKMVANRGVVLNRSGDTTALLTRLSDGMGWVITAEPGEGFVYPVWVDDDEVWMATAKTGQPNFRALMSGILRVKRSTLGAPTVVPGL